ncbi:GNAT family N-acetyltransferase [Glutamicibacter sp. AGC46]
MEIRLAAMAQNHWADVARIYASGIETGLATFESEVSAREKFFAAKIPALSLVAIAPDAKVLGWAAASPVSARPAYHGVVEHSVYIDPDHAGCGIGTRLLAELIARAREEDYWMVQSAVIAGNEASRVLHARAGFREVGRRERIARGARGAVAGQWLDTVLYELRL